MAQEAKVRHIKTNVKRDRVLTGIVLSERGRA
jgi:hypothetical protein